MGRHIIRRVMTRLPDELQARLSHRAACVMTRLAATEQNPAKDYGPGAIIFRNAQTLNRWSAQPGSVPALTTDCLRKAKKIALDTLELRTVGNRTRTF